MAHELRMKNGIPAEVRRGPDPPDDGGEDGDAGSER